MFRCYLHWDLCKGGKKESNDLAAFAFGNLVIRNCASSAGFWLHATTEMWLMVLALQVLDRPDEFRGSCHQVKSTKLIDLSAALSFHSIRVAK